MSGVFTTLVVFVLFLMLLLMNAAADIDTILK